MPKTILDATVLINFGRVDAIDRFLTGLPDRIVVGLLVEKEVRFWPLSSNKAGQPFSLKSYVDRGILEQTEMTPAELGAFYGLKARLKLGDGETEALVIAASRGWSVATDDGVARKKFATHNPTVRVTGSIGLLREMIEARAMSRQDAQLLLTLMRQRGSWLPDKKL
jgi:predicted nucleic acid-binding protein